MGATLSVNKKKVYTDNHSIILEASLNDDKIPKEYIGCPVDRNLLGKSSWNLLHAIAINYPESPNEKEKSMMLNFIESFAYLYPCSICAKSFQESIKKYPPRIASRKDLCIWMCERHNEVNHKLGKPLFPCTIDRIEERWLVGHVNCWNRIIDMDDAYLLEQQQQRSNNQSEQHIKDNDIE